MTWLWGEAACLGAAIIWAGSVCIYRRFAQGAPAYSLNLFKNSIAISLLAITLLFVRPEFPNDPAIWISLALSGLVGIAVGDTASLASLKRLGAPVTAAGLCLGPPLAAVLAMIFLDEKLNQTEWLGVWFTMAAVIGVIFTGSRHTLALKTHSRKEILLGVVFLVISGLSHAVGVVLGRYGMRRIDVMLGTSLRILPSVIFLLGVLAVDRKPVVATFRGDRKRLMMLAIAAVGGTYIGLILMSIGLKHSKAGVATAILGTYPIWVVPMASRFLGEKTRWETTIYIVLAALGICLLVMSKH